MPHRDFDAARAERMREVEPLSFTLGGETFRCVNEPTIGDALALADAPEPTENESAAVKAILAFVGSLVVPEDQKRWRRMLARQRPGRRNRHPVGGGEVVELGVWLAVEYSGRPSGPSTGSSAGRHGSGDPSNVSSSTTEAATSTGSG
jgi:hypothetical protein